jgi:hypothetical protein
MVILTLETWEEERKSSISSGSTQATSDPLAPQSSGLDVLYGTVPLCDHLSSILPCDSLKRIRSGPGPRSLTNMAELDIAPHFGEELKVPSTRDTRARCGESGTNNTTRMASK